MHVVYFRGELSTNDDADVNDRSAVMLINLSDKPEHWHLVDDVGFSLVGLVATRHAWPDAECGVAFPDLLVSLAGYRLSVVVLLPEFEASAGRRVAYVASTLREIVGRELCALALVTDSPAKWRHLDNADGFVQSDRQDVAFDSLAVMALFATLMSPTMLTCSDEEDVLEALGGVDDPSRVVVGRWDYETRQLTFASDKDRKSVAASRSISLSPMWFEGKFASCRELMRQLHELVDPLGSYLYHASSGHFAPALSTARSCPVVLLCGSFEPTATEHVWSQDGSA